MQKCRRVSGAFDFRFPIADCGFTIGELRFAPVRISDFGPDPDCYREQTLIPDRLSWSRLRSTTCDQTQKGADVWKRMDVGRALNRSCRPSSRPLSVYPERSRRVTEGPSLAPLLAVYGQPISSQRVPIHGVFTN